MKFFAQIIVCVNRKQVQNIVSNIESLVSFQIPSDHVFIWTYRLIHVWPETQLPSYNVYQVGSLNVSTFVEKMGLHKL